MFNAGRRLWCSVILIFLSWYAAALHQNRCDPLAATISSVRTEDFVFSLQTGKNILHLNQQAVYICATSDIEIRRKSCNSFGQKTVYYKEADILQTNVVGYNRLWSNSQTQMRHYQCTFMLHLEWRKYRNNLYFNSLMLSCVRKTSPGVYDVQC